MFDKLLEFGTYFDWTALPRTVLGSIRRHKSISPKTLLGLNDWPFFVPMNAGWSGRQVTKLLDDAGIDWWGWGVCNGEMFFRVAKSDAPAAQQILLSHGVPLSQRLIAGPAERPPADELEALDAELREAESWARF